MAAEPGDRAADRMADPGRLRRRSGHVLELRRRGPVRRRRAAVRGARPGRGGAAARLAGPPPGRGRRRVRLGPSCWSSTTPTTSPTAPSSPAWTCWSATRAAGSGWCCAPGPTRCCRSTGTGSPERSRRSAATQLSFTPDETRELLTAMGVPVTAEVARALCAETQGWAVGLRLAAAPLKQGVPPERLVTSLAQRRRQRGPVPVRGGAGGPAGQRPARPAADQRDRGAVARPGGPALRPAERPARPRRAGARQRLRRGVPGCARRLPHPPAVPGDAAGPARLRAPGGARRPAPDVRRLVRRGAAGRSEAVGHAVAAEDWGFVTRLLIDDLLVTRLLAHGTDPALRGLRVPPARSARARGRGDPDRRRPGRRPPAGTGRPRRVGGGAGRRATGSPCASRPPSPAWRRARATDVEPAEFLDAGRRGRRAGRRAARRGGAGAARVRGGAERPARARHPADRRPHRAAAHRTARRGRRRPDRGLPPAALPRGRQPRAPGGARGAPDPGRPARGGGRGVRRRGGRGGGGARAGRGDGARLGPPSPVRAGRGAGMAGAGPGAGTDRRPGRGRIRPAARRAAEPAVPAAARVRPGGAGAAPAPAGTAPAAVGRRAGGHRGGPAGRGARARRGGTRHPPGPGPRRAVEPAPAGDGRTSSPGSRRRTLPAAAEPSASSAAARWSRR